MVWPYVRRSRGTGWAQNGLAVSVELLKNVVCEGC